MEIRVEYMSVGNVVPYDKNPRRNDAAVDAVAESIRQFGFKVPIVVDANNVIVAGHTRHAAALKLGMGEVPVIRATDLSEDQVRAYRLADNKTAELAEWDHDSVKFELDDLDKVFDMKLFGFDEPKKKAKDADGKKDKGEPASVTEYVKCPRCGRAIKRWRKGESDE